MGVIRHVDAGYDLADSVASERGVRGPMREGSEGSEGFEGYERSGGMRGPGGMRGAGAVGVRARDRVLHTPRFPGDVA
ncbi:hypothetical protein SHIRM173S_07376 [Streptomyces hirsutus]